MSRVVLYGRPGCHLCDEARRILEDLRAEGLPFELVEVDIDGDDELLRSMLERIPVIAVEGREISDLTPDAGGLRASIATLTT